MFLRVSAALAAGLAVSAPAADFEDTYAIVGARIEIGDGRVIEKGTVLVSEGKIAAVGADVKFPAYAVQIKGEGLTVYPGFIDAFYLSGTTLPDPTPTQDTPPNRLEEAPPRMRVAGRKGVRPEIDTANYLSFTPASLIAERAAGFTLLNVAATGGIINGTSALVDVSGGPRRDSVLKDSVTLDFGFRTGGREGYPNSLMGAIATIRQAMMDGSAYQAGPGQPNDPVLARLSQARRDRVPFAFEADTVVEIDRAKKLVGDYAPRLIITGGLDAFRRLDLLEGSTSLIAGVNFAAEPRRREATVTEGDDSPALLQEDRQRQLAERVGNLAVLSKAGIPFGLTGRGTRDRAEFFTNLRRAMKAGCPRDAIVRALAYNPARMLGVDRLVGTVEVGKLANLTVMKGDLASEDAKTSLVFIRGRRFDPTKDRLPPTAVPRVPSEDDDGDGDGGKPAVRGVK